MIESGVMPMTTHFRFQNIDDRWIALHPDPKGLIQFIGGAFLGALPVLVSLWGAISYFDKFPLAAYHFLLENVWSTGYSIVVVTYRLTFNHWSVARRLHAEQQQLPKAILTVAKTLGYDPSPYKNPAHYLWIGHSLGCEYITLLRSLSRQSKSSGNSDQMNPLLRMETQPALLMAPCFQPPNWLKPYKQPTQTFTRQLLIETARHAPTAMISFNQDFTAGNLMHQMGDVYWIYQQLENTPEGGLVLHRELPGNHYQPVGYETGDLNLTKHVIDCLERLKTQQSEERKEVSLPISTDL
jgi:hypothetical protein